MIQHYLLLALASYSFFSFCNRIKCRAISDIQRESIQPYQIYLAQCIDYLMARYNSVTYVAVFATIYRLTSIPHSPTVYPISI